MFRCGRLEKRTAHGLELKTCSEDPSSLGRCDSRGKQALFVLVLSAMDNVLFWRHGIETSSKDLSTMDDAKERNTPPEGLADKTSDITEKLHLMLLHGFHILVARYRLT